MLPASPITRHLGIRGRVQGVGFRFSLQREARARGVAGWVRNRRDGSVEAVVQGEPAAVEALIAWAQHGPPGALVSAVSVSDGDGDGDRQLAGFETLPTA
jgi:acylphosphatase